MTFFKFIKRLIESVIILGMVSNSYQQNTTTSPAVRNRDDYPNELPGALTSYELYHNMSIAINYSQYTSHVVYPVWFNNPLNYAYWDKQHHVNTSTCIAYILGTPRVHNWNPETNLFCDFLSRYFPENGTLKPWSTDGLDCVSKIPVNPCKEQIENDKTCGEKTDVRKGKSELVLAQQDAYYLLHKFRNH
jgi:hypothetical protein